MKNTLLILIALIVSQVSYAKDSDVYLEKLNKCDKEHKISLENDLTNGGQKAANYNAVDCYEKVAFEIIDKYYSEDKDNVKANLLELQKSLYASTGNIYMRHNNCLKHRCGTMNHIIYTSDTMQIFKKVVNSMISVIQLEYER